jgi:hypothetical protein
VAIREFDLGRYAKSSNPCQEKVGLLNSNEKLGPSGISTVQYYNTIIDDVNAKEDTGMETSITDHWGRSLSFQLFNASTGSPGKKQC